MDKKVDRRIRKTQAAIETSFKKLLQEKASLDEISVKMICDEADITRKTFYVHYADKSALVMAFMDNSFAKLKLTCRELNEKQIQAKIDLWINYFIENKVFFKKLLKSHDSFQFRKKFNDFTKAQLLFEMVNKNEVEVDFICYGIDGIIENVILAEHQINKAELSKTMQAILAPYLLKEG